MKTAAPKIGIVSGVGPLAGSDVLGKLLAEAATSYGAVEDNEYPDAVLISHGIQGVDNTGMLSDIFRLEITQMVQSLVKQGATIIGIACNTAHVYLDSIQVPGNVTLVNLIDAVACQAKSTPGKKLLLTSNASRQQQLYHPYLVKYGVPFSQTNSTQQAVLDRAIALVMAHKLDGAGGLLDGLLAEAHDAGFAAIIAGCTELPIAIDHAVNTHGLKVVDSNLVLAKTLLAHYYENKERLC